MTTQSLEQAPDVVLQRIDAIVEELFALRQLVSAMKTKQSPLAPTRRTRSTSITEQLSGALKMPSADEVDYPNDLYLDLFTD